MVISASSLNRATLARQSLLRREPLDAADAVRRVVALQAQQPASPYIALWNRVAGFDPDGLDAALAGLHTVRSTLMRITLHVVHADDYRDFREAMDPTLRGSRLGDRRFRDSGLTAADADALLPDLLRHAEHPTEAAELLLRLEGLRGAPLEPAAWRMLRQYVPWWHAPAGGPWSFDARPGYVAPGAPPVRWADPDAAAAGLAALIVRYLEGFGPATVADMAQFTLVQRGRIRGAVQTLADRLERLEGPDGTVLYDVPGAPRPGADTPAPPRLMAMWDSVLLAYADRSRVVPPAYRRVVIRANGDVLPTLLVDGRVAGVWRSLGPAVEVSAFHPLPERVWDELADEARSLTALLADRDPVPYRRYDHWWAKGLPAVDTRLLPAGG
ncbi:winged helix DNA-binding domain-containing protein [Streptomyces sp. NRRL WC-3549]|uniref:winged helix DNA-binding domain-containing protein n=1 Tax=Streptomyces sp. NRRL WC-3549 TaxID=1463925 RepID=UPI0004C91601|nr:winged helix DNA-binding domain-containing protein [Streptomyces sp. NRRL WC-3549]